MRISNDHVTDDVRWPWKVKIVTPICLERNISKTADLETPFQRTTNRKWHMLYQMIMWPMTSRDSQMCCEEVRSANLATAWLLAICLSVCLFVCHCILCPACVANKLYHIKHDKIMLTYRLNNNKQSNRTFWCQLLLQWNTWQKVFFQ